MDSPGTLATFGTQHTGQRKTKHKNTPQHKNMKRWATRIPPKTGGKSRCSRMVSNSASYKTPAVIVACSTWVRIFWISILNSLLTTRGRYHWYSIYSICKTQIDVEPLIDVQSSNPCPISMSQICTSDIWSFRKSTSNNGTDVCPRQWIGHRSNNLERTEIWEYH
jgi:hypothetical protein